MILVRSPLRICLAGGGTDLLSYSRVYGGFCVTATIDKYVYVAINKTFEPKITLKYSQLEEVKNFEEIKHPIIRESLKLLDLNPQMEISTMADIPSCSGLGSSSAFTVALLKALHTYDKKVLTPRGISELASFIEINKLKENTGKQDMYASAYGGINCLAFNHDESVDVISLRLSDKTLYDLEDNLLMFFTGYTRKANIILKENDDNVKNNEEQIINSFNYIKQIGYESKDALEKGDTKLFGVLMNSHWNAKKAISNKISNDNIDKWYDVAMQNGALGGKICGAGGGGFFVFYAEDRNTLRETMKNEGLEEVRFRFDFEGTKIIHNE